MLTIKFDIIYITVKFLTNLKSRVQDQAKNYAGEM